MSLLPLSLRSAPPPNAAIEIAPQHVSGAVVEMRGGQAFITAQVIEPLPDGALTPSLTGQNVRDLATVAGAVSRVVDRLGRPRRTGLLIPDAAVKVSLLRFEHVPERRQDLDEIVRWQVRKAAPFPLDSAQVGCVPGRRAADGQEFIVTLARREIVDEYEGLCVAAGTHPGVVDIATFNVINAVLAGSAPPDGDWLLVNVASEWASMAVLRGAELIFFRTRSADTDGTLTELVHQTAMYYEDRLEGAGFSRILLSGASTAERDAGDAEPIRRRIQERLGVPVDTVDVRAAASLTDRIVVAPVVLDALAPLVGVLLRGQDGQNGAARR
jgi:Tfp pilus assembly PilM family ATPase